MPSESGIWTNQTPNMGNNELDLLVPNNAIATIKVSTIDSSEKIKANNPKASDEGIITPATDSTSQVTDQISNVNPTVAKVSSPILYKLEYKNQSGDLIYSEESNKPFTDVKEDESYLAGSSIFEIIRSVTVHNQVVNSSTDSTPPTAADVQKILGKYVKGDNQDGAQDGDQAGNQMRENLRFEKEKDFEKKEGLERQKGSNNTDSIESEIGFEKDGEFEKKEGLRNLLRIRAIDSTRMIVKSTKLLNAIRSVVEYYPSQSLAGENVRIEEPYTVLVHHRDMLEDICKKFQEGARRCICAKQGSCECNDVDGQHIQTDQETVDHIEVLLEFLDSNYKKKVEAEKRRWNSSPATATFEMIWLLLKPGTKVYTEKDNMLAGFIVRSAELSSVDIFRDRFAFWKVKLWYLNYDGRHIGRSPHEVYIRHFNGEMNITSLRVFPIEYKRDGLVFEKLLTARGQRYFAVLKAGYVQTDYEGDSVGPKQRKYTGRVILDPASYYQTEVGSAEKPELGGLDDDGVSTPDACSCKSCKDSRRAEEIKLRAQGLDKRLESKFRYQTLEDIDPKKDRLHEDDEDLINFLLPRGIPSFIMKERTWKLLDISCAIEKFETNTRAIESLAMPQQQLNMIKALSAKFSQTQSWPADFIQNKGEGQIFLLHGPPGVGKTYTAECIAEYTGRPLLSLTCADIGTDEMKMENKLAEWFALAETWGAVMLIDEADVYLEVRQSGELQRNSLVSAFLRAMEYYRGILFLTTNRIGHMDTAIMSRVHLIIRYDPLTNEQRTKIWEQFFDKLERERPNMRVEPKAQDYILDEYTMDTVVWNGREIRNAFQTAVALAEYDAQSGRQSEAVLTGIRGKQHEPTIALKQKHFKQVVDMSRDFKQWFNTSFGTEAVRAMADGSRRDMDPNEHRKSTKGREKKIKKDEGRRRYDDDSDIGISD